jgi:hypothetical protein
VPSYLKEGERTKEQQEKKKIQGWAKVAA